MERARLRHASRLFDNYTTQVSKDDLIRLEPEDFLASRVFQQAAEDVAAVPDARKTLTRHTIEAEHAIPTRPGTSPGC